MKKRICDKCNFIFGQAINKKGNLYTICICPKKGPGLTGNKKGECKDFEPNVDMGSYYDNFIDR
jgi:hypothetical protein